MSGSQHIQMPNEAAALPVGSPLDGGVRRRVCLTSWRWCADSGGYMAPCGWTLQKHGAAWVARIDGTEVLRDMFLCNVMMELCG